MKGSTEDSLGISQVFMFLLHKNEERGLRQVVAFVESTHQKTEFAPLNLADSESDNGTNLLQTPQSAKQNSTALRAQQQQNNNSLSA